MKKIINGLLLVSLFTVNLQASWGSSVYTGVAKGVIQALSMCTAYVGIGYGASLSAIINTTTEPAANIVTSVDQVSLARGKEIRKELIIGLAPIVGSALLLILMRYMQANTDLGHKFEVFKPGDLKITFDNVIGCNKAKEELQELVEYIKDPNRYKQMNVTPPRGILLSGAPGCGKTLLVKALAGSIENAYLLVASGADFVNAYQASGSTGVTSLFNKAKSLAKGNKYSQKKPTVIIFIDEIDALLEKREHAGSSERSSTVNTFLTCMDGFNARDSNIIVIGATNFAEKLDVAAIRSGRFDIKIEIQKPTEQECIDLLQFYLKNVPHQINLECIKEIAKLKCGCNAADIKNWVDRACRLAVKEKSQFVTNNHITRSVSLEVSKRSFSENQSAQWDALGDEIDAAIKQIESR